MPQGFAIFHSKTTKMVNIFENTSLVFAGYL